MKLKQPPRLQFTAIAKENGIPLNVMRAALKMLQPCESMREINRILGSTQLPPRVCKAIYLEYRKLNQLEGSPTKRASKTDLQRCKDVAVDHIQIIGDYWLHYAETALKDDVYPSLFSSNPGMWVHDACNNARIPRPVPACYRNIIDHTTKYIITTLYKTPLKYIRTTQWMVTRAMSH